MGSGDANYLAPVFFFFGGGRVTFLFSMRPRPQTTPGGDQGCGQVGSGGPRLGDGGGTWGPVGAQQRGNWHPTADTPLRILAFVPALGVGQVLQWL